MFPKNILVIFIAFIIARTSVSAADYNITELLEKIRYLDNFGDTIIEVSKPNQFRYVPVTKKGCFNFWVKTDNEAHISLSNSAQYELPKVEIIIGGWGNTASGVVINQNHNNIALKIETPGIIKMNEFQGFWIRWSTVGDILVGKMLDWRPFLVYKIEPKYWYPINFVGVNNEYDREGSWIIKDEHYCEF